VEARALVGGLPPPSLRRLAALTATSQVIAPAGTASAFSISARAWAPARA
jgi:hypothetical protein